MTTYFIMLFAVIFFAFLSVKYDYKNEKTDIIKQKNHTQLTLLFYIVVTLILIFVAGLRYYVGADFANYFKTYEYRANIFFESLLSLDEPGYFFLCWLVVLFKGNGVTVIFLSAAITIALFMRTIYKNTNCLFVATILFIFLGCWHGTFNGIRQYFAAAILFAGIRYLKERKFWKYAFVVFIAFLFHASAIVMIFTYFIAYNKISFKNILFLIVGSLIILVSFDEILNFAGFVLDQEFQDSWLVGDTYITRSVNVFRILVAVAPAVLFVLLYQNRVITDEQKFWLNMLILNAIMSFATSNSAYLARVSIYTIPFVVIAIPELLKGLTVQNRKVLRVIILLAYFLFWFYEVSTDNNLNNFQFVFGNI